MTDIPAEPKIRKPRRKSGRITRTAFVAFRCTQEMKESLSVRASGNMRTISMEIDAIITHYLQWEKEGGV